eukprot:scaffold8485_cov277-Pinguiococcus_pyrenoidosus.AAC.3
MSALTFSLGATTQNQGPAKIYSCSSGPLHVIQKAEGYVGAGGMRHVKRSRRSFAQHLCT